MQQILNISRSALSEQAATAMPEFAKRVMDFGLVLLALPVVLPVILLISIALGFQGFSVFYAQDRVGRDGRNFRIWKFRSMVPDADEMLALHLAGNSQARAEWAASRKLRNDPRVTVFGRFLRASSLDELPQLWNILRGDMSLVGPRPVPRCELQEHYGEAARAYLTCRPGLTGLWQISGRNSVPYDARIRMDRYYAWHRSLALDLAILGATFAVVLRGEGL